jgi:hypothetical protein
LFRTHLNSGLIFSVPTNGFKVEVKRQTLHHFLKNGKYRPGVQEENKLLKVFGKYINTGFDFNVCC